MLGLLGIIKMIRILFILFTISCFAQNVFFDRYIMRQSDNPFTMTINAASVSISMKGTGTIQVDWGVDSARVSYALTSTAQSVSHAYASSALRTVKIYNASSVNYFSSSDNANYSFNWSETTKMNLTYFVCSGDNTLHGTLSLPSIMTYFRVDGSNTLSGVLLLPALINTFRLTGSNTISGTLYLPASTNYFYLSGNNTISEYFTQIYNASINIFILTTSSATSLSSAKVDQLLTDLNYSWGNTTGGTITITGANMGAPSCSVYTSQVTNGLRAKTNPPTVSTKTCQ